MHSCERRLLFYLFCHYIRNRMHSPRVKIFRTKLSRVIYGRNRYAWNAPIHIALGVNTLNEEIKRPSAKLCQPIRQHDNPTTVAHPHPHPHPSIHPSTPVQSWYYSNRSLVQATCEWHTAASVAPYSKSKTTMDTPRLRCQSDASIHTS
jgi:hypothetical protein